MPKIRLTPVRHTGQVPALRLPCLPESAAALLRVHSDGGGMHGDILPILRLDPVLFLELLSARPLERDEVGTPCSALARRARDTDGGLIQAWALRHMVAAPQLRTPPATLRHFCLHSQLVAELTAQLARECGYPQPEEAYVMGLLHDVGQIWAQEYLPAYPATQARASDEQTLAQLEWDDFGRDHAELSALLVSRCGLSDSVVDAIALHQSDPSALRSAHPLVRLMAAAESLAAYRHNQSITLLNTASQLSGLEGPVLINLLADVTPLIQSHARLLDLPFDSAMLALPWSAASGTRGGAEAPTDPSVARAALGAFARGVLDDSNPSDQHITQVSRLLLGLDAPLILSRSGSDGMLCGLPSSEHPDLERIRVACDDEGSSIAEAARSGRETRYQITGRPPGRSASDWQLARWLACDGLLCVPWNNTHENGVAVFPYASDERETSEFDRRIRRTFVHAATGRAAAQRAELRFRNELEERVSRRYIEHARRIAHEVSNPLTVIKTYLGIIDEKIDDATMHTQLGLLSDELDRVGALVRKATDFNGTAPSGPTRCGVAEILHDLRALYGDALFASRGIHFELRTGADLPQAELPPDVLKQILLNLLKNAAEALPEDGTLSVSVTSGINTNGTPSLEIRLTDNGPGLSAERVTNLFRGGAQSSDKPGGGVGLPLVRELIVRHGGTILCRSQPGSGTVFHIFLPLAV